MFNKGFQKLFFLSAKFNLDQFILGRKASNYSSYHTLNISLQLSHSQVIHRKTWEKFWLSLSPVKGLPQGPLACLTTPIGSWARTTPLRRQSAL